MKSIAIHATGIKTLDNLLREREDAEGGIAYLDDIGFFGVIFGAAGSGKSILSIELCCKFVGVPKGEAAVYLSHESPELICAKIKAFGFLEDVEKDVWVEELRGGTLEHPFLKKKDGPDGKLPRKLYICQMPLEENAQLAKLENIFETISQVFKNNEKRVLFCLDNAETVSKENIWRLVGRARPDDQSPTRSEKPNFFKWLRAYCAKRKLKSLFVFEEQAEEGVSSEQRDVSTTAQAYAADLVIRLGLHTFPSGFKERSLEIIKAKNQYYRRGIHHFSIVSNPEDPAKPDSRGIIIYPSLPTQLFKLRPQYKVNREAAEPVCPSGPVVSKPVWHAGLGIPTLDRKISAVEGVHSVNSAFLTAGSVSVLVSDLDARATEIALHFAYGVNAPGDKVSVGKPVFISLSHTFTALQQDASRFGGSLAEISQENCHFFSPEHISEGKLLSDFTELIDRAQKTGGSERGVHVVVDGLFALQAKYPLIHNTEHFLAALFALFKKRDVIALVVDMVEVGEGRNPIDKSIAAGLADNVFLLRHVELNAATHTVFSVATLFGSKNPESVWDLCEELEGTKTRLVVRDTFDFYKDVLSGKPTPAQIRLSLHADARYSPLENYLEEKKEVLRHRSGFNLELHTYTPDQYRHFQSSMHDKSELPLSDCHIISVDEVWLENLINQKLVINVRSFIEHEPLKTFFPSNEDFVTAAHDLALSHAIAHKPDKKDFYAFPDRNNCGIFCTDEFLQQAVLAGSKFNITADNKSWTSVRTNINELRHKKLVWKEFTEDIKCQWEKELRVKKELGQLTGAEARSAAKFIGRDIVPFTICMNHTESCVSFLIELVLAHVTDIRDIVSDGRTFIFDKTGTAHDAWREALILLVDLLDEADLKQLSTGSFRQAEDEPRAMFSRQWFSTYGVLAMKNKGIMASELPTGPINPKCVPVSGAWYLAVVNGSVATRAGLQLIIQLARDTEELHRVNRKICLPVRKKWYDRPDRLEMLSPLLYAKKFLRVAEETANCDINSLQMRLLESNTFFYRPFIKDYSLISPVLLGLMVEAAKIVLGDGGKKLEPVQADSILLRFMESLNDCRNSG